MRILFLGANGFIGSRIVARLLADGHRVCAAVRDPERLYRLMGLAYTYGAVSLDEFREQVIALRDGLNRADQLAGRLKAPSAAVAQLVGLSCSQIV